MKRARGEAAPDIARQLKAQRTGDDCESKNTALPTCELPVPTGSSELQKYDSEAGVVRLLGDPILRVKSVKVDPLKEDVARYRATLHATLRAFRKKWGFGRGIAAVQIGIPVRMIALNLGDAPFTLHNPEIIWRSDDTFTMFDDCMSFPDLMVRVRRHKSISVRYQDDSGDVQTLSKLPQDVSELLQHEMDHCDGVLAVDRATGSNAIVYRSMYLANREFFDATTKASPPCPAVASPDK